MTDTLAPYYVDRAIDAYVECALWSSTDESDSSGGKPLDENYSSDNIDGESLADMQVDVESFCEANANLLTGYVSAEQCGHDFWLTRNRHGAGFWDRGLGKRGDDLTTAAHAYGESNLYVGDDDVIYLYGV